jgi:hypothetical protein
VVPLEVLCDERMDRGAYSNILGKVSLGTVEESSKREALGSPIHLLACFGQKFKVQFSKEQPCPYLRA